MVFSNFPNLPNINIQEVKDNNKPVGISDPNTETIKKSKPAAEQAPKSKFLIEEEEPTQLVFGEEQITENNEYQQILSVKVPRLNGMDELLVSRASFKIRGLPTEQEPRILSTATYKSAHRIYLTDSDDRRGFLTKVEIVGITVDSAELLCLSQDFASNCFCWDGNSEPVYGGSNGGNQLYFLFTITNDENESPPVAAMPYFDMPDNQAGLYGPALAGGTISLGSSADGKLKITLKLEPGLNTRRFKLVLGKSTNNTVHNELPNKVQTVKWRADELNAYWSTSPQDLEIHAQTTVSCDLSAQEKESSLVALFSSALPDSDADVDFTAASRSLMRSSYEIVDGSDPENVSLNLIFKSKTQGIAEIRALSLDAQYRSFPDTKKELQLRGGGAAANIAVPAGMKPEAFTVTLDGSFGPGRLLDTCSDSNVEYFQGVRLARQVQAAHWMPLSSFERGMTIIRIGIQGRATGSTELMISLHAGGDQQIGAPIGDPVSMIIEPEMKIDWHQSQLDLNSPHPEGIWVKARVTKGVFWWHGQLDHNSQYSEMNSLLSNDDGQTWQLIDAYPQVQLHVHDGPRPADIKLFWDQVQIAGNLLDPNLDISFRQPGSALLGTDGDANFQKLKNIEGQVNLVFSSRRDVDFHILDAALTYNPWEA